MVKPVEKPKEWEITAVLRNETSRDAILLACKTDIGIAKRPDFSEVVKILEGFNPRMPLVQLIQAAAFFLENWETLSPETRQAFGLKKTEKTS